MSTSLSLVMVVIAMMGSALYAGLETGIVSINPLRMKHLLRKGTPNADTLNSFVQHPDHLLGTALVGTNLCNVIASVTAVSLGSRLMGASGYVIAYALITVGLLVLGEYLPKTWFQSMPAKRSLPFAKFLKISGYMLYPISRVATALARILVPIPTRGEHTSGPFLTKEDLLHLTHEGERTGTLSTSERHMIEGALALAAKPCRDLMVPRANMMLVQDDTPTGEIVQIARSRKISRLPVYKEETSGFVGIIYIFDVLEDKSREGKKASDYMRPPQFVSGDTPSDDLVPRMRMSRQPMALVTNRASEVIGLITIEDILSEIVGTMTTTTAHQNS